MSQNVVYYLYMKLNTRDKWNIRFYEERNKLIVNDYKNFTMTVEKIALKYKMTPRQIQRICKEAGVIRTIAEANKGAARFKNYDSLRIPEELKAKRKKIPPHIRYRILKDHPFCKICGAKPIDCPLSIDHINGDATDNDLRNLQVLCLVCNYGKR